MLEQRLKKQRQSEEIILELVGYNVFIIPDGLIVDRAQIYNCALHRERPYQCVLEGAHMVCVWSDVYLVHVIINASVRMDGKGYDVIAMLTIAVGWIMEAGININLDIANE